MPANVLLLLKNIDLSVVKAIVFTHMHRHLEVIRWEIVGKVEDAMLLVPGSRRSAMCQVGAGEFFGEQQAARHTLKWVVTRDTNLTKDVTLGSEVICSVQNLHGLGQPKTAFASEPRPKTHTESSPSNVIGKNGVAVDISVGLY